MIWVGPHHSLNNLESKNPFLECNVEVVIKRAEMERIDWRSYPSCSVFIAASKATMWLMGSKETQISPIRNTKR